jgi:hypothetical protein
MALGDFLGCVDELARHNRDLYNLRNWHIVVLSLAASVLNGIVHNVAYLM